MAPCPLSSKLCFDGRAVDRGYDADWFRKAPIDKGTKPFIPGRKSRKKTVKYSFRDIALQCTAEQWIRDATSDATVSGDSRTGGGSHHAMTDHQPSSSRQSHPLQPSYSGYES